MIIIYVLLACVALCFGEQSTAMEPTGGRKTLKRSLVESCKQYQHTYISATAKMSGENMETKETDITTILSFSSSNSSIAVVSGNKILGVNPGTSTISVVTNNYTTINPVVNVSVSSTPIDLLFISVFVVTDAIAIGQNSSGVATIYSNSSYDANPSFSVKQEFLQIGDTGRAIVYANFSDGMYRDITEEANITSLHPALKVYPYSVNEGVVVEVTQAAIFFDGLYIKADYPTYSTTVFGLGPVTVNIPLPSALPSHIPTPLPTTYTDPALSIQYLIHPEIVFLSEETGYFVREYLSLTGPSTWTASIAAYLMAPQLIPGSEITMGIAVSPNNGKILPTNTTYKVPNRAVASVDVILRSEHMYEGGSSDIVVMYQLRDAAGHAQVYTEGLVVVLTATVGGYTVGNALYSMEYTCSTVSPDTGIGECRGGIPAAWYVPTTPGTRHTIHVDVTTSYTTPPPTTAIKDIDDPNHDNSFITSFTSRTLTATLHHSEVTCSLPSSQVGMLLSLPPVPFWANDFILTDILAATNGNALVSWRVTLGYDNASLSYSSIHSDYFVINSIIDTGNALVIDSSGLTPNSTWSAMGESFFTLFSIHFQLFPTVAPGSHNTSMYLHIDSMNDHTTTYFSSGVGKSCDYFGENALKYGRILVLETESMGILAYARQNELVNMVGVVKSPDNSTDKNDLNVTSAINVLSYSNALQQEGLDVSHASNCSRSLSDSDILSVEDCVVTLTTDHTDGSVRSDVTVSYKKNANKSEVHTSIPYRIWYLENTVVTVSDEYLNAYECTNCTR